MQTCNFDFTYAPPMATTLLSPSTTTSPNEIMHSGTKRESSYHSSSALTTTYGICTTRRPPPSARAHSSATSACVHTMHRHTAPRNRATHLPDPYHTRTQKISTNEMSMTRRAPPSPRPTAPAACTSLATNKTTHTPRRDRTSNRPPLTPSKVGGGCVGGWESRRSPQQVLTPRPQAFNTFARARLRTSSQGRNCFKNIFKLNISWTVNTRQMM